MTTDNHIVDNHLAADQLHTRYVRETEPYPDDAYCLHCNLRCQRKLDSGLSMCCFAPVGSIVGAFITVRDGETIYYYSMEYVDKADAKITELLEQTT